MPDKTELDPADLQAIAASGRGVIRCTCGFLVIGDDDEESRLTFAIHPCPNRPAEPPTPWQGYVFSWPVLLAVVAIGYFVLFAIGARP